MRSTPFPRLFVALLATLWLCSGAHAEPPAETPSPNPEASGSIDSTVESVDSTASPDGLRIYRDPETGAWLDSPSPEQEQALSHRIDSKRFDRDTSWRSSEGLVPFDLEGGGRGVFLAGRFTSALWVHRHADGSFHLACDSVDADHGADGHHGADGEHRVIPATPVVEAEDPSIPTDDQGRPLQ